MLGCSPGNDLSQQIEKCVQARIKSETEGAKLVEARNIAKFGKNWRKFDEEKELAPKHSEVPEKFRFGGSAFAYLERKPEYLMSAAEIESVARLACLAAASGSAK
jgi:hypothetical protein